MGSGACIMQGKIERRAIGGGIIGARGIATHAELAEFAFAKEQLDMIIRAERGEPVQIVAPQNDAAHIGGKRDHLLHLQVVTAGFVAVADNGTLSDIVISSAFAAFSL